MTPLLLRRLNRLAICIGLLLLTAVPLFPQRCDEEDRTVRAKALIAGFFPELKRHALYVSIYDGLQFQSSGGFTNFSFVLEPMPIDSKPGALKDNGWPLISHFTFRTDGILAAWSYDAEETNVRMRGTFGSFGLPQRVRSAIIEVDAHPEWSETDIVNALKNRGAVAAPAPGSQGLQGIDVAELAVMFPEFRIVSAKFDFRDEYQYLQRKPSAELLWRVEFVTRLRNKDIHYIALVDPFNGKPFSIGLFSHLE